jgi:GDP-4-dehydro-6-deoxy-D-mannose reductase
MTRILITGASGFIGTHLIEYFSTGKNVEIWGLTRQQTDLLSVRKPKAHWIQVNLSDRTKLAEVFKQILPDVIYHLAGQAHVASSWEEPAETVSANVINQIHLLEALRETCLRPTVLIAGSSEEYGQVEVKDLPVHENTPFRPLSPYAVSKVAQDLMAYQYFRSYGFRVIRTRAFNHTGPGRPDSYAISGFSKQIAKIEAGVIEPVLHVGNLKAMRDYLDVRDVVCAYDLAVKKGQPGEAYNICSGKAHSIEDMVAMLLELSSVKIRIQQDPNRLRPSDIPVIYGDVSKFHKDTGWEPKIPFCQTMLDLLNYWRQEVASGCLKQYQRQ